MSSPTTNTPVNTTKVTGRRELHFTKLADIQAEAERLAAGPVRQLGNWTLGQTFSHLARTMKMSLDGSDFRAPWYIRLLAPLLKNKFLRQTMKPGFKLTGDAARQLVAEVPVPTPDGLDDLRKTMDRMNCEPQRHPSPVFGPMTREEWDQLHLRHSEMHLSFFVPE
ncbi:MAG TPA: DUF1569 domain-containing protein [Pirellulales bacterium]|nr:DUF1569 domain-containing protein [Pirellulales bacterium]